MSTVHIGQQPHFDSNTCEGSPYYPKYPYSWKKTDTILVDKDFNTLVDPRDKDVIMRFGFDSDNKRLYGVTEACIQPLGAGDITWTFFAQYPTRYGYEQVVIWEGKFRSYASVKKSTRAWVPYSYCSSVYLGQISTQESKYFRLSFLLVLLW